jgi:hypothetical protein
LRVSACSLLFFFRLTHGGHLPASGGFGMQSAENKMNTTDSTIQQLATDEKHLGRTYNPKGYSALFIDRPRPCYSTPHQENGEIASQRIRIQVGASEASKCRPEPASTGSPCPADSGRGGVVELGSVRSGGLVLSALRIPVGLSLSCGIDAGGEDSPTNVEAWHPLPGATLRFRLRFVTTLRLRLGASSGLSSAVLFGFLL